MKMSANFKLYRMIRALATITSTRAHELESKLDQFANYDEYIEALRQPPQDVPVFAKHLLDQPEGWDPACCGDFPEDGVLLLYMKLASTNQSIKSK